MDIHEYSAKTEDDCIHQTLGSDAESQMQVDAIENLSKASHYISKIRSVATFVHVPDVDGSCSSDDMLEYALSAPSCDNQNEQQHSDILSTHNFIPDNRNDRKRLHSQSEGLDTVFPKRPFVDLYQERHEQFSEYIDGDILNGNSAENQRHVTLTLDTITTDQTSFFGENQQQEYHSNATDPRQSYAFDDALEISEANLFPATKSSETNIHSNVHNPEHFSELFYPSNSYAQSCSPDFQHMEMMGYSENCQNDANNVTSFQQYNADNDTNRFPYQHETVAQVSDESTYMPNFTELQSHQSGMNYSPYQQPGHVSHDVTVSDMGVLRYDVAGLPSMQENMSAHSDAAWVNPCTSTQQPYLVPENNNQFFQSQNESISFNQNTNSNHCYSNRAFGMAEFTHNNHGQANEQPLGLTHTREIPNMKPSIPRADVAEDDDVIVVSEFPANPQYVPQRMHKNQPTMSGSQRMKFYNTDQVPPGLPKLKEYSSSIQLELLSNELWQKFHEIGTEMIITKAGRRMFPTLKINITGLHPQRKYVMAVDVLPLDNKRYRYAYTSSQWIAAGNVTSEVPKRTYVHPESPATGETWMKQTVVFDKMKLTNNEGNEKGHIILHSMHKYQPRIHLIECDGNGVRECETIILTQCVDTSQDNVITFVFKETQFTTVTAYQNQQITKLKIDKNPFAKGFRDTSKSCKAQQGNDRESGNSQTCSLFRQTAPPVVTIGPNQGFTSRSGSFQLSEHLNQTSTIPLMPMTNFQPSLEQYQQNDMNGHWNML